MALNYIILHIITEKQWTVWKELSPDYYYFNCLTQVWDSFEELIHFLDNSSEGFGSEAFPEVVPSPSGAQMSSYVIALYEYSRHYVD